eukprot:365549-Chlamydomonas_euryale.AAC.6
MGLADEERGQVQSTGVPMRALRKNWLRSVGRVEMVGLAYEQRGEGRGQGCPSGPREHTCCQHARQKRDRGVGGGEREGESMVQGWELVVGIERGSWELGGRVDGREADVKKPQATQRARDLVMLQVHQSKPEPSSHHRCVTSHTLGQLVTGVACGVQLEQQLPHSYAVPGV